MTARASRSCQRGLLPGSCHFLALSPQKSVTPEHDSLSRRRANKQGACFQRLWFGLFLRLLLPHTAQGYGATSPRFSRFGQYPSVSHATTSPPDAFSSLASYLWLVHQHGDAGKTERRHVILGGDPGLGGTPAQRLGSSAGREGSAAGGPWG